MKKQIFKVSLAASMLLAGVNSFATTTAPIELYTPQTVNYNILEDMTISSSSGAALSLLGDGTLSSPITVSNTKNVSIDGLSYSGEALQIFNANLTNSGTITATGTSIHAISLNGMDVQDPISHNLITITPGSYSVENTGTITVVDNYGVALYLSGGINVSTTVTNGQTGIIQSVKADGTVGNNNTAIAGWNLTIQNEGIIKGRVNASYDSSITNSGTITGLVSAQGEGASTDVLEIVNTGTMTGGITTWGDSLSVANQNVITGNISVSNRMSLASLVNNVYTYVYNQNNLDLTNNGTLTGNVSGAGTALSIVNNGTLTGNISGANSSDNYTYNGSNHTSSDHIANHDAAVSVENNGNITGNITTQELLTLNNSGNITGDITLSNSSSSIASTINNMGNGVITGNITSAYNMAIDNDGLITGKITAPTSSFINHGNLVLSAPISSNSGITSVLSTLDTFENHGALKFSLNTDGTNTAYSKLEARVITLKSGSTIGFDVNGTSNSDVKLLVGQTLSGIVSASETLTVEDETIKITDASPLIKFKLIQNGNQLDTLILKEATYNDVTVSGQGNNTAQKAAKILDLISDNSASHPAMDSVFERLNNETEFNSAEKVAKAVESTTPQSATSSSMAASQISSNIASIAMQRQNPSMSSMTTGNNSGDEIAVLEKNLWIKPYGSIGSQANKDGLNGFGVKSYGIGMGFDSKNKADQLAGFGLFFTDANVDMNNVSQETDIKSYSMLMYGSLPVIDNRTNFLYQLGYGLQKTDSKRDVFTGDIATADYTSKIATIDARLVRDYQMNKELLLQPLVYSTYRNFKTPSYSETGAGALNLDVEQSSSSEMIVGLGTIATYKLNPTDKLIGSLSVGYDLKDDKNIITSSYSGASGLSFETEGIDNGRLSYDAGIGYEKAINTKNSINVNYNFQGKGTDYTNNVVSANYIYKF